MDFAPPALDTAEAPAFTPPPVDSEEFTPPPLTATESSSGLRGPHIDPKFIGKSPAQQLSDIWSWATRDISSPTDRLLANARQMKLADAVSPVQDEAPKPLLPPGKVADVAAGVGEATAKTLDSFINTRLGITTLGIGGLPATAQKIVSGLFAANMIKHTPEIATQLGDELGKPEKERDYSKIGSLLTQGALNTGFAVAAGTHALTPGEAPPVQTSEPAAAEAPARQARNAAAEAPAQLPERPETIAAQLDWLTSGKRKAVLLTPGADMPPLPEGTDIHPTDAGTFIFHPDRTSPEALDQAVAENKIGDVLDYGIADKPAPEQAVGVVTIRDLNGIEKQAVVTDAENLKTVLDKAKALAGPTDTVQMETPEQVLAGRQPPPAAPVETPTMRMAREQRETMAALRAQNTFLPPSLDQEEVTGTQPGANGDVKVLPPSGETVPGGKVVEYLKQIGTAQGGFSEFQLKELGKYNYELKTVPLSELLASDSHFAENGPDFERRDYEEDGGLKSLETDSKALLPQNIPDAPIIVVDGEIKDGLSRASAKLQAGEPTIEAYVAHTFSGEAEAARLTNKAGETLAKPTKLKPVEITAADYKAARQGNNPFMEVQTATGLAKEMKRAQEFGQDALTERAGATEPRLVNQLFVGDQFTVKGQPIHVADWVTDADTGEPAGVNVDGAYGRQFVPAGETMHIDAGSLADPVASWFNKAIAATEPNRGVLMEGVTSAPVWMTKTAINAALKIAKFAYTKTRDIRRSVGEAVRFLRAQNLAGFNEGEALDWLESNLRGDPITQDTGRTIGAATEERRPLENTSAAQQMSGSNVTTTPFQQDLQAAVTGIGWRQRASCWLGGAVAETFPRTTRLLRVLGEQGARWISSRAAANPLADAFSEDVTRGLNLADVEFGAMLHEDNLRSVQQAQLDEANRLQAAGDLAGAAKLRARAQQVFTFVGKGGVFPDEATYQEYLQKPTVQAALQRHIATWTRQVDPMFREAMKLDPAAVLPARGLQTGARINLNFVREGETGGPNVFTGSAAPKGVLSNVLQRRSPFGRLAKGTAEAYRPSYSEAMRNTFSRQLEIANRNKFDRMMVDAGHAVIDRPGRQNEIKIQGEGVTPFEIKRTVLQTNGQRIPQFENIYVRNSIAPEYRSALNLDPKFSIPVITPVSKLINGLALSGLTEVTAHIGNLSHSLFWRPGVTQHFWREIGLAALGRADAFVAVAKAMRKFTAEDQTRIRELTEIAAMREPPPPKSGFNPTKWGGKLIEHMDIRTRLQLDRMYQNLAEQGLVPKTETARREFVNQIGQYNRRAQGQVMHWLRDTGIAPFVTAGRAFNVLALRTALLHPGVESTGVGSRLAMAATMASKVGGTLALIGTLNYLLTRNKGGGVFGRPGVALGAVDLGLDDKNKRPLTLNLANILGLQRVARVTGVRGGAEALRYHLPLGTVLDSTYRDLQNSWTAPILGPVARTVSLATTGRQPAIGVPRTAPVVPPGQSQVAQNLKTAAIETSPIIAGVHDSLQPGATGWEWLQKQGGRFTLQPGKPAQMVEGDKYKRIVARAQASDFVNDVIMRARKMQGVDRANYVRESIMQLDPRDRPNALRTLEERRIIPPGVAPH